MSPHSVSAAVEELRVRGYVTHLVPMPGGQVSTPSGQLDAARLRIDERYSFLGEFVPTDVRMVVAARWTDDDGEEKLGVITLGCAGTASTTDLDVLGRLPPAPVPEP